MTHLAATVQYLDGGARFALVMDVQISRDGGYSSKDPMGCVRWCIHKSLSHPLGAKVIHSKTRLGSPVGRGSHCISPIDSGHATDNPLKLGRPWNSARGGHGDETLLARLEDFGSAER